MKFKLSILALLFCIAGFGQNLKTFTRTMHPDSLCYLSLKKQQAYTKGQAAAVKTELDFGLFETRSGNQNTTEWFNLKPDNEKVPEALTGTTTRIAAISFDRDQFDKCRTAADLKRMTGYLSTNSLANFAVVRNSKDYYQRCFIIETSSGKRGLIFVTETGNGRLKVEVKAE